MTQNILDAQLGSLHLNNWDNSRYDVARSEIDSTQDYESYKNIKCPKVFNFEWLFKYKKAVRKMGALFTHIWS